MPNNRTVLLWRNNGEERIYFPVNPMEINISRPNQNRVPSLAMGGTVNAWGGRGLREVKLWTSLRCEGSPFYSGQPPETAVAAQMGGNTPPVRMRTSGRKKRCTRCARANAVGNRLSVLRRRDEMEGPGGMA